MYPQGCNLVHVTAGSESSEKEAEPLDSEEYNYEYSGALERPTPSDHLGHVV
jgi:hypothetical protein